MESLRIKFCILIPIGNLPYQLIDLYSLSWSALKIPFTTRNWRWQYFCWWWRGGDMRMARPVSVRDKTCSSFQWWLINWPSLRAAGLFLVIILILLFLSYLNCNIHPHPNSNLYELAFIQLWKFFFLILPKVLARRIAKLINNQMGLPKQKYFSSSSRKQMWYLSCL